MTAFSVRAATAADHAAYARLCPELGVDDPIATPERFAAEMAETTLVAVGEAGEALGYSFYQPMQSAAYVRHVVTAPEARRRGVARALLEAVATRARESGCESWCLNVEPRNAAARALYEGLGFELVYHSQVQRFAWALLEHHHPPLEEHAWLIDPSADEAVEKAMRLEAGQLALGRAAGRVLMMLEDPDKEVVGMAQFDPAFPGAYPFRVARPELALDLLHALRSHARTGDPWLQLCIEGQPEVAALLRERGAEVRFDMMHLRGSLG